MSYFSIVSFILPALIYIFSIISIHELLRNIYLAFVVDISEYIKHCFKYDKYPPSPLPKDITLYSMIVLSMGVPFIVRIKYPMSKYTHCMI